MVTISRRRPRRTNMRVIKRKVLTGRRTNPPASYNRMRRFDNLFNIVNMPEQWETEILGRWLDRPIEA